MVSQYGGGDFGNNWYDIQTDPTGGWWKGLTGEMINRYTGARMGEGEFYNKYLRSLGSPSEDGYVWSKIGFFIPKGDVIRIGIIAYAKFDVAISDGDITSNIINWLQGGLEIGGLIPGFREIADGINAVIYGVSGEYGNAGLSLGAMIPFAGWGATGAKATKRTLQLTSKARTAEQALDLGTRILKEGYAEIAPGVFRSADGLRQFRMTDSDLIPLYNLNRAPIPHVHFQFYSPKQSKGTICELSCANNKSVVMRLIAKVTIINDDIRFLGIEYNENKIEHGVFLFYLLDSDFNSCQNDTWFDNLEIAQQVAFEEYGIAESTWELYEKSK